MNNVYFSNEGMTSTTANYYANIAKELQNAATERLNSVKFFRTSVAVIGSNEKQLMSDGISDLSFITEDLQTLASLNAFCAWVREAIKEKEEQQKLLNGMDEFDWAKEQGITLPTYPTSPDKPKIITETDVMNSWDINKRNKYLRLEAFASTYGKYIHPDGAYSKARKKAHNVINNPIAKDGTGRDMVLYYMEESVNIETVDQIFMILQDQYRGYEKELNQMKAELKETVNDLSRKLDDQYQETIRKFQLKTTEYYSIMSDIRTQFNTWRINELEKVSKLKITIPENLKEIFKIIKEVGDTSK